MGSLWDADIEVYLGKDGEFSFNRRKFKMSKQQVMKEKERDRVREINI